MRWAEAESGARCGEIARRRRGSDLVGGVDVGRCGGRLAAEEGDDLGGEFFAEALDGHDVGRIGRSNTVNAAEVIHERATAHGTEAGHVVEDGLADLFGAEIGVVGVGEAVGLVAQALQELQAGGGEAEVEGRALVGEDDGLVFFGEADEGGGLEVEGDEGFQGGTDLAAAAVDHHEVRHGFALVAEAAVAAANDFLHGAEVVVADEAFDLEAAVVVFVGPAGGEVHHRGDDEGAADVGDVEALHVLGRGGQVEGGGERGEGVGGRVRGVAREGLLAFEAAGFGEGFFEREDDVAQLGGFFEVLFGGGGDHLLAEGLEPLAGFAFEELAGVEHALAVVVGGDDVVDGVDFLAEVVVELPAAVGLAGRGGVGEEDAELAAHLREGFAQESAVGEGAEVAGAVVFFEAGEAEAGEFLGEVDANEGEAFIVGEVGVVFGFPLLDEAALEEEGFGLGLHLDGVEVGDHVDERADLRVVGHGARRREIGRDALFEGLGLADVNDATETILHEVDARLVGEVADLFLEVGGFAHGEERRGESQAMRRSAQASGEAREVSISKS